MRTQSPNFIPPPPPPKICTHQWNAFGCPCTGGSLEIDSPDVAVRIASELLSSVEEPPAQVATGHHHEPSQNCKTATPRDRLKANLFNAAMSNLAFRADLASTKLTGKPPGDEGSHLHLAGKTMPSTTRPLAMKASQRVCLPAHPFLFLKKDSSKSRTYSTISLLGYAGRSLPVREPTRNKCKLPDCPSAQ